MAVCFFKLVTHPQFLTGTQYEQFAIVLTKMNLNSGDRFRTWI